MSPSVDETFLMLEPDRADGSRVSFELDAHLCRFDGRLYGGTALAVAVAAFERTTDRSALWATVQFVAQAERGERIDVVTDVVAHGRRVDQVQLRATVDDRLIFAALGSTGERIEGMSGTGPVMPRVRGPESARFGGLGAPKDLEIGWHLVTDLGEVGVLDAPDGERGRVAMWARVRDHGPLTAAKLGYLADMVPLAVARACGVAGAGTSLDNSLRVGRLVDTDWVLLELIAHTADAGFGHGDVLMWAPDGTLLASGSQTAKMFAMDALPS